MADEIFTVAQTAQYLQVCEKTVRRLISANKLIASRVGEGNRSLRIKKSDIDDYLAEQRFTIQEKYRHIVNSELIGLPYEWMVSNTDYNNALK